MSNSSSNNSGCLNLVGMIGAAVITALGVVGAAFITNVDKFVPKTVTASSTATPPASIINNKPPVEVQTPSPVVVITPSPAIVIVDEAKILKDKLIGEWKGSESCKFRDDLPQGIIEKNIAYLKTGIILEDTTDKAVFSDPKFTLINRSESKYMWNITGSTLSMTKTSHYIKSTYHEINENPISEYDKSRMKSIMDHLDKVRYISGFIEKIIERPPSSPVSLIDEYKVLHIDKNSMTLERISASMGHTSCNPRIVKLTKVS